MPSGTGRRGDADEVGPLLHLRAQLAQLGRHGGDAVSLLDAPAGDVAEGAGAVGVQGHHGQRHGGVGNVVAVQLDRPQRPGATSHAQLVGAAVDVRAHLPRRFDEADIALDRVGAHAFDDQVAFAVNRRG
jgi:hypothetical protein